MNGKKEETVETCWKCKVPDTLRDWKAGDLVPPFVTVDGSGRPLDTVRVCGTCGGCMVGMVRKIEPARAGKD